MKSTTLAALVGAVLLGLLAFTSLKSGAAQENAGPAVKVIEQDDAFAPPMITVAPGTTVTWINQGQHPHTTSSTNQVWDSGPMPEGATFSYTFKEPGTYRYVCKFHQPRMEGTVVVK